MTSEQLDYPVNLTLIREKGFCVKGTRNYWKALGLDFNQLIKKDLVLRDLEAFQEDLFVKQLIEAVIKEKENGK